MNGEDKKFFMKLFNKLEQKVEEKAEQHKAKFAEIGSQLALNGETMLRMESEFSSKITEVKSSVNANVSNISANSSAIAVNQREVSLLKQEMQNVKATLELQNEELINVKAQANDIQRRVYKNIVVISGHGVPPRAEAEDITAIAMDMVETLTGVKLSRDSIRNCHRMGAKILLESLFAGNESKFGAILNPKHRRKMAQRGTWINIHQNKNDREIGFVARKMKKAGLIEFFHVNSQGVNEVTVAGVKHKVYTMNHLQNFCPYSVKKFLESNRMDCTNDSAVGME